MSNEVMSWPERPHTYIDPPSRPTHHSSLITHHSYLRIQDHFDIVGKEAFRIAAHSGNLKRES